ncbi:MAG: hypothetical protein DMF89_10190 [Acidobacteria bacterium]|nr:MAG: hypothetical protein DMF89_10190 [Acidobacteriota bacterium]
MRRSAADAEKRDAEAERGAGERQQAAFHDELPQRASSRFARLAQAINSTNTTAPCRTSTAVLAPPTICACSGSNRNRWFFVSGVCGPFAAFAARATDVGQP